MPRQRKDPGSIPEIPALARRIRDLREDRDLKQREVADYLHISQRTYADYELGNLRIPIDILLNLAEFYDADMNYMCALTNVRRKFPKTDNNAPPPRKNVEIPILS